MLNLVARGLSVCLAGMLIAACGGGSSGGDSASSSTSSASSSSTSSASSSSSTTSSSSSSSSVSSSSSSVSSSSSSASSISSSSSSTSSSSSSSSSVSSSSSSSASTTIIAGSGLPAIGLANGIVYSRLASTAIGRNGHLAFTGVVDTSVTLTAQAAGAVWSGPPGQVALIIKENDPIQGLPSNVVFGAGASIPLVGTPIVSSSGNVAMAVRVKDTVRNSANPTAWVVHAGGVNTKVLGGLQTADPVPGLSGGATVATVQQFAFSDAGMAFAISVSNPGLPASYAVLFWDFNTLQLVAATGVPVSLYTDCSPAAGAPFVLNTTNGHVSPLLLNDRGDIVFSVQLASSTSGNSACPQYATLNWRQGTFTTVADSNQSVPNITGTKFGYSFPRHVNASGGVTFNAVIGTHSSSWYKQPGTAPRPIVISGETLPTDFAWMFFPNATNASAPYGFVNDNGTAVGYGAAVDNQHPGAINYLLRGEPRSTVPYSNIDLLGASQLNFVLRDATTVTNSAGASDVLYQSGIPFIASNGEVLFKGFTQLLPVTTFWLADNNGALRSISCTGQTSDFGVADEPFGNCMSSFDGGLSFGHASASGQPVQISDNRKIVTVGRLNRWSNGGSESLILLTNY